MSNYIATASLEQIAALRQDVVNTLARADEAAEEHKFALADMLRRIAASQIGPLDDREEELRRAS